MVFSPATVVGDVIRAAKDDYADVIVVGARANSAGKRLLGSMSEGIVQYATCDVFVVR